MTSAREVGGNVAADGACAEHYDIAWHSIKPDVMKTDMSL
jgi:hypothetical protein